jgi:hypothetical protein
VTIRLLRFWRALGACVVMLAWFAVSNHCGMAMLALFHGLEGTAHACCQSPEGGGSSEAPGGTTKVCCKQLRLPAIETGAKLVRVHDETFCFECDWTLPATPGGINTSRLARDKTATTGPPGLYSFAEVVLQQSLLSHAPPARV